MKNILVLFVLVSSIHSMAQDTLINESFDNGIPASWTILDGDGHTVHPSVAEFQTAWIGLQDPWDASNNIAGSTSYFEPEAQAYRFLITPQISLGAYGNIVYWRSMSHDPSFPDWIMVLISTTGTEIEDFTDTLFRLNNEFTQWTDRSINISDSGFVNQNVYLAFVNHTNRGFKLYIDDVIVEVNNPLSTPNLTISNVKIYPNPASDYFNFLSDNKVDALEIVDVSGKVVLTSSGESPIVDVSLLNAGIYYIRFFIGESVETKIFKKL